jgi:hypothetical protein
MPTTPQDVNSLSCRSVPELADPIVVDAKKVCDLVHYRHLYLPAELGAGAACPFEGTAEDRDPIGEAGEIVGPVRQRDTVVEPEERVPGRVQSGPPELRSGRLVLDHDRDVDEMPRELVRDPVEGLGNEPPELGAVHSLFRPFNAATL